MRSPLTSLAGEKQASSFMVVDGVGKKSSSAAKKRSSMSASSFSNDDDIDKQSTSANASNSGGADPATNAMVASGLGSSTTSNGSNSSNSKRMKLTEAERGPVIGQFLDVDEDDEDDEDESDKEGECNDYTANATSTNATSTTDIPVPSSVKKLKGWLSDFEQKQKEHYERIPHHNSNNPNPNAAASSSSATPSRRDPTASSPAPTPAQNSAAVAAMARAVPHTDVVKARSTSMNSSTTSTKNAATPGRMLFGATNSRSGIPSIRHTTSSGGVEATNDGYASVSKLSAWLEDDPTSKKKGMPLAHRRGRNVSLKSRKFEPLPQNDATRTVEFRRNGVSERKQWLESAFKKDDESKKVGSGDGMSVADRKKWLQGAFAKKDDNGGGHKVRRDDDGLANVAYAEVGPEEELISSGRCCDIGKTAETNNETNNEMNNVKGEDYEVSSSTCSSFSIGKQMLESRTEKNGARGVGLRKQDDEEDLKASVQSRRAALEKREESRAHAEQNGGRRLVGAVRAHWEVGGSGNSQSYSKSYVPEDDRRCTPAKKLSDLP